MANKLDKWVLDDDDDNALEFEDSDAVHNDGGELAETIVTYEDSEADDITSFSDFITNFVSGTKVGRWFKNFRAGIEYILHVGSLVNNCVTDNADLPLSAAQGKVLMDELTQVKSDLSEQTLTNVTSADDLFSRLENLSASTVYNAYCTGDTMSFLTKGNTSSTGKGYIQRGNNAYNFDYFMSIGGGNAIYTGRVTDSAVSSCYMISLSSV